jgi:hypothetical protein
MNYITILALISSLQKQVVILEAELAQEQAVTSTYVPPSLDVVTTPTVNFIAPTVENLTVTTTPSVSDIMQQNLKQNLCQNYIRDHGYASTSTPPCNFEGAVL